MKRIIVLALACAVVPFASAQLYKYVDKDGKTVYSDQPPVNVESKQINVSPGVASTPQKSYVARDKELDKAREAEKERDKKRDTAAETTKADEERCAQARESYRVYQDGGRLFKSGTGGERELMSDDEIAAARDKSRQQVDEACKK